MSIRRGIVIWPILGVLALGAGLLAPPSARATIVTEDFSYTPDNTGLAGKAGGVGWDSGWAAGATYTTSRVKVDAGANLSYSGGGYDVAQTGTGRVYQDHADFRGVNRNIDTDLSGTVWFSILVQNVNDAGRAGIQFNNPRAGGNDYIRGNFGAGLNAADQLEVRWNNVDYTSTSTYTLGDTHLLLGRILVGAGNDSLDVWVDPASLTALGTPVLSFSGADMGDDVFRAGVFGEGITDAENGYVDALRLSDGNGSAGWAFYEVTGVIPEPTTALIWSLLAGLGVGLRWRRRK